MIEYKDAFGEELKIGDKVMFHSYESMAKGTIIGLEVQDEGTIYKPRPVVVIEKESGPGMFSWTNSGKKPQPSKLTRLEKVAKI